MCQSCCQRAKDPVDKPKECSPEQIRECHGDDARHPCTQKGAVATEK